MEQRIFKHNLSCYTWLCEAVSDLEEAREEIVQAMKFGLHKSVEIPKDAPEELPLPKVHAFNKSPVPKIEKKNRIEAQIAMYNTLKQEIAYRLSRLQPEERQVLIDVYVKGVPVRQIAIEQGVPKSTMYDRIDSMIERACCED